MLCTDSHKSINPEFNEQSETNVERDMILILGYYVLSSVLYHSFIANYSYSDFSWIYVACFLLYDTPRYCT